MPADGAATGTDRRRHRVACCDDGPGLDGVDFPPVDVPELIGLTLPPAGHDAGQERRCDVVLDKLATRARNARYLSAILNGVTGFAYIAMGEAMLGLADLGRAVYKAVFESDEERAQRKYEELRAGG